MKRTNLILRSLMFVPGHNEKLLEKAAKSNADALALDIEDSVLPVFNKETARARILRAISKGIFENRLLFPRINDRESGLLLKDITALTVRGISGFIIPKVLQGNDIYFIDKLLETIEYEKGFEIGKFKIIPLIETASAVLNAQEICLASDRVIAIAFGCEDFIADLEGVHDLAGNSLFTARALIALAARATGVIPIDTVHVNVHDLEDLEKNLKIAKGLGFEGQLVLHPKEIDLVNKYYSPSQEEVEEAREMLDLFEQAQENNKGVAIINGKFIGPPMVIAAKKVIERNWKIRELSFKKIV